VTSGMAESQVNMNEVDQMPRCSAPGPRPRADPDMMPPPLLLRKRSASNPDISPRRRNLIEVNTERLPLEPGVMYRWQLPTVRVGVEAPTSAADLAAPRIALVIERRNTRTTVSVDHRRLFRIAVWGMLLSSATGLSLSAVGRPSTSTSLARATSAARAASASVTPADRLHVLHSASLPARVEPKYGRPAAGSSRAHPAHAEVRARLAHVTRYLSHEAEDIEAAMEFATDAHEGQRRKSGEPFVVHPIEVACILAELKMDSDTIIAGLLHDTVEDTEITTEDICDRFGSAVASIVSGVTDGDGRKDIDNQRDLLLAMSSEWRVALVKLADRLHNMRTLGAMPVKKQVKKSKETLELFVPLARALGVREVEAELQQLSSTHLHLFPGAAELLGRFPVTGELLRHFATRQCPSLLDDFLQDEHLSRHDVASRLGLHRERWAKHHARWLRD